jgi:hypothetical protein
MWPQTLAIPGFLGGAAFSMVLGIAAGRRRFDELSMPRFAGWGALGGVVVSIPLLGVLGVAVPSLVAAGVVTVLCTASAVATLALARSGEDRELLDASADVADVGLSEGEARELLGGRD